jgi:hypothetical protein
MLGRIPVASSKSCSTTQNGQRIPSRSMCTINSYLTGGKFELPFQTIAAPILERVPIVFPEKPKWMVEYMKWEWNEGLDYQALQKEAEDKYVEEVLKKEAEKAKAAPTVKVR